MYFLATPRVGWGILALRDRADAIAAGGAAEQLTIMGQGMKTGMGFMNKIKSDGKLIAG